VTTLGDWIPVLCFLAVALMIPVGMVGLGFALGSRQARPDVRGNKHLAFESGVSTGHAGRQRFPIDFYLTAMLFIVFDIETVFLYPLGVVLGPFHRAGAGTFVLWELAVFLGILLAGYVYVWGRGALDWE
jgi:NADH-quinone oxidoreductase subunit A